MAVFILKGGYRVRYPEKRSAEYHNKVMQPVFALTQDIEAVATQMGQEVSISRKKFTQEDGDFLFKNLQKIFNNAKGFNCKKSNITLVEIKPEEEKKTSQSKEDKKLNFQPKERLSERKVKIDFASKIKDALANRKLYKECIKFLRQEKKKKKKLSKSKELSYKLIF